jgi:hypothetical protein
MTSLTMQLHALLLEIKATDRAQRGALRSRLDTLIREMEAQALPVEPRARALNEKLLDEAIEAQFDNLPV